MDMIAVIPPKRHAIRQLRPSEARLFREHLLRLDSAGRRARFPHGVGEHFLAAYVQRSFCAGALVLGCFSGGGIVAAAELHERADLPTPTAEIALSVELPLRGHGIGSRLLQRLVAHARRLGYAQLRLTLQPGNRAMLALARRYGARLMSGDEEIVGMIDLCEAPALAA